MLHTTTWKSVCILLVCALGILFALPNMFSKESQSMFPEWMPPLKLGLDLQGGSQILLEVDMDAGLRDQLSSFVDLVRGTLRREKIGYTNLASKGDSIRFTLRDSAQAGLAMDSLKKDFGSDVELKIDGNIVSVSYSEKRILEAKSGMLQASIEMVRNRIDQFGTTEPNIQQQGDDRVLVQLPGVNDPSRVRELLGKTAKLTFRMVHPQSSELIAQNKVPAGYVLLESSESAARSYVVEKQVMLSGENLENARAGQDRMGRPAVDFQMDTLGGKRFFDITRKYTGHQFAIILDNKVLSAPVINEPIPGGRGQISGHFTLEQANDLAILMRAGALPAPMTIIEERTVGPDLGADSILDGKNAILYSLLLVALFMILCYSFFGFVATAAVIINVIILIGLMSVLQSTLTLPGVAGIALTIGMAVDANVLIYERIKEELRNGSKMMAAIESGYTLAMSTIIDSNLTTFIGSALMFMFGTGPIAGFGVTTSLGICISMFTAITLTRLIVAFYLKWRRPQTLSI